jgi:hypothetical protein
LSVKIRPDNLVLTPPAYDDTRRLDELLRRRVAFVRIQPGMRVEMRFAVFIDNGGITPKVSGEGSGAKTMACAEVLTPVAVPARAMFEYESF